MNQVILINNINFTIKNINIMYVSNMNYLLTSNTKSDKIELSAVSKRQLIALRLVFWPITSKLSASKSSNIYRSSNSFNVLKHACECQSMFVWLWIITVERNWNSVHKLALQNNMKFNVIYYKIDPLTVKKEISILPIKK